MKHQIGVVATAAFLLMLAGCSGLRRTEADDDRAIALVGGTIYAQPEAMPLVDGVVVIQGTRIRSVGTRSQVSIPDGSLIIDVSGQSVLPAFWNSHVHFMEPKWAGIDTMPSARADSLLREMFTRFGFVHVFDLSSSASETLSLRRRILAGEVLGPDILTTAMGFVPVNGTPRYVPFRMPELADARHARDSVRARMLMGADGVKLFAVPITRATPFPVMPLDVVRAATDEVHRAGGKAFAHPTELRGAWVAVNGGVDVLTHPASGAEALNDSILMEMRRRQVSLIPTLTLFEQDFGPDTTGLGRFVRSAQDQVREYSQRGGRILFGTDVGYITLYDPTREYELMAGAGLSFDAILRSLTTAPADEFGFARSGRLSAGFDADIVVVDGDPVLDIRALGRVRLTMKRGCILYGSPRKARFKAVSAAGTARSTRQ